jgi:putative endonuclease
MPYVYVLKSQIKSISYTGSTIDLQKRIFEHNMGLFGFTKRRPWILVYSKYFEKLEDARIFEKYLKSAAGRRFIKKNAIIPGRTSGL